MDDKPWWRRERRHVPGACSRNDVLVERRHVLPVVRPVIDIPIRKSCYVPPKEPRKEGVKRMLIPLPPEEHVCSIHMVDNSAWHEQPKLRHKLNAPHAVGTAQRNRDMEVKLEKLMGIKKHTKSIEQRNLLPFTALGDKTYKQVEQSSGFFSVRKNYNSTNNNSSFGHDLDSRQCHDQRPTTTYEIKKKVSMLCQEKEGVAMLSTSKAGQLSWEEVTGNRTWKSKGSGRELNQEEG